MSFTNFIRFNFKVVVRMRQYKDDLMSSCLQLVLSLPNELVLCDIDVIIPVLKVNTTQCYLVLIQVGSDALL